MNTYLTVSVGLLTGIAIGGVAIQGLHAQGKPPVYLITEVDVTDPEKRDGPAYLNRISASLGGASAGIMLPCGGAAR